MCNSISRPFILFHPSVSILMLIPPTPLISFILSLISATVTHQICSFSKLFWPFEVLAFPYQFSTQLRLSTKADTMPQVLEGAPSRLTQTWSVLSLHLFLEPFNSVSHTPVDPWPHPRGGVLTLNYAEPWPSHCRAPDSTDIVLDHKWANQCLWRILTVGLTCLESGNLIRVSGHIPRQNPK